jgi:prophage DNA circulation protein
MTWRDNLRPASFRGIPFFVESHDLEVGRRKFMNEFGGSNDSYVEDLGRKGRVYQIEGYVIGDDYMSVRDQMIQACEMDGTAGSLVHPWLGTLQVQCDKLKIVEKKNEGGRAGLVFTFFEQGKPPAPVSATDTSAASLFAAGSALSLLVTAFTVAFSVNNLGAFAAALGIKILGDVAGQILGLAGIPTSLLTTVAALVQSIVTDPTDAALNPATSGGQIADAIQAYADAAVDYASTATADTPLSVADIASATAPSSLAATTFVGTVTTPTAAPSVSSSAVATQRDPTAGLIAFAASFAAQYAVLPPPVTPDRIAQGVNQQAVTDLVNASVAIAVATIYAQCDFDSSDAADAARDQVIALFSDPIERAADTGADDLYQGLKTAQAAALTDIAARGSALAPLQSYTTAGPRTAIGLAFLLYPEGQDVEPEAQDLITRNSVIHPAFMPRSGEALSVFG